MDLKDLLKIFIVGFLIFSLIIFINSFGLQFNDIEMEKKQLQVITVEGLENNPLITSSYEAFCKSHSGFDLESSCNRLTENNCNSTSCCVWTSDFKCKAGNASGPLFNSNSNGKTIPLKYYYFQNKCYGDSCSKM